MLPKCSRFEVDVVGYNTEIHPYICYIPPLCACDEFPQSHLSRWRHAQQHELSWGRTRGTHLERHNSVALENNGHRILPEIIPVMLCCWEELRITGSAFTDEESVVWSRSRAPGRDSPKYGSQAPPRAAGFSPAAVSNALLALHVRESAGDNWQRRTWTHL